MGDNEIIVHKDHNIGIAVDTERGLLVPVIKQADSKSVFELARDIMVLAHTAQIGKTAS